MVFSRLNASRAEVAAFKHQEEFFATCAMDRSARRDAVSVRPQRRHGPCPKMCNRRPKSACALGGSRAGRPPRSLIRSAPEGARQVGVRGAIRSGTRSPVRHEFTPRDERSRGAGDDRVARRRSRGEMVPQLTIAMLQTTLPISAILSYRSLPGRATPLRN